MKVIQGDSLVLKFPVTPEALINEKDSLGLWYIHKDQNIWVCPNLYNLHSFLRWCKQ